MANSTWPNAASGKMYSTESARPCDARARTRHKAVDSASIGRTRMDKFMGR